MTSRNTLRIAPSQAGIQAAQVWRLWRSSDEFYAASRSAVRVAKISFHSSGRWQMQVGTTIHRLVPSKPIDANWGLAVSFQWLLRPDALVPTPTRAAEVLLIAVPAGHKLAVNLLLSSTDADLDPPAAAANGTIIWRQRLSSGRLLLAHAATLELGENDAALSADVRRQAIVEAGGDPTAVRYGEIVWHRSTPESGNLVAVIPIGPETIRGGVPGAA